MNIGRLYRDGKLQFTARFPNKHQFLHVSASNASNEIDSRSAIQPDGFFDGADIRIRIPTGWKLGNVRKYTQGKFQLKYHLEVNTHAHIPLVSAFFLDNLYKFLDDDGEWFFDKLTKKVYIYSRTDPNRNLIEGVFRFVFLSIKFFSILKKS